ncbi:lung adenoma susceptibility protein 2 isoform X1 [Esox lucius]|uniref:Lung adenoma susceptibility protein 2 n=2 Tax=Esox lucius TaxID=8010 RepID=A0A3P8YDR1_ESOLU|nr:lung adenoma susceptibility protein 2 isoform X1 [Esox lucius]
MRTELLPVKMTLSSPESTVTSLLASSGHLRSSLCDRDLSLTGIRYRDRDYESATEALEAYIADFDRNQHTSESFIGRLQLQKCPTQPRTGFKNKDVLKESLTERELDFLDLPVGSSRCGQPDRLSLTTDDLLVLPCDGSLPVTRTSAFLVRSGSYPQSPWQPKPNCGFDIKSCQHYSHHELLRDSQGGPGRTQKLESSNGLRSSVPRVKGSHRPHPDLYYRNPAGRHDRGPPLPDSSPHHDYPRWLTRQKSTMDFSGITSIPDIKYPAWLQEADDISSFGPTQKTNLCRSQPHTLPPQAPPHSPRLPSWLNELEASYEELQEGQTDRDGGHFELARGSEDDRQHFFKKADHRTLRELRLQFAEQLAIEAEEERSTDFDNLCRNDKMESLILKGEKAMTSPSLGLTSLRQKDTGGSPCGSEYALEADRSWDNPTVTNSPVPVGGAEDPQIYTVPLQDRKEAASRSCSSGYSSRKHPGPVEALKHMLFSLQALEQRVTPENSSTQQEVILEGSSTPYKTLVSDNCSKPQAESSLDDTNMLMKMTEAQVEDYETSPGGQSLQRALHHLVRLKTLVEDSGKKAQSQE